jgi:hypothetical protein
LFRCRVAVTIRASRTGSEEDPMAIDVAEPGAGPAGGTRWTTTRIVATVAILAALVASAIAVKKVVTARLDRAPYTADAVGAAVRMQLVAPSQAQATADRLADPGRLVAPLPPEGSSTAQLIVGQLTFRTPPNAPADGQYALFVIDRAQHKSVSALWGAGPAGTDVGQGWDSRFNKVAAKYPWLSVLADQRTPSGDYTNSGMAVSFAPNTRGPVTFAARLDAESLPITDPSRQLTVALVFIGANDHVYWATKLAG